MDLYSTVKNSVTPEDDPGAEKRLDPESKETLKHISTNSGRAFFWKQLAQYALTATAIFGGIAIGGAAVMPVSVALGAAGGTAMVGLISSLIAHRIEIKNELSLEELYARRTGQCVADSIEEKSQQLGKLAGRPAPLPLPPMPYQEALHTSGRFQIRDEAMQEMPRTNVSSDQITSEQILLPEGKTLH